jgi:CubicO group peptidase (beta-lactamase class C family)
MAPQIVLHAALSLIITDPAPAPSRERAKANRRRNMNIPTRVALLLAGVLLSLACWAAPLPEGKPEDVGISPQRLERLTAALQSAVDSGELPGMVAAIARKGKLVYFKSFGAQDKGKNIPMRTDAIFRAYSMTKPIVSVAAMMLVEEGKLGLHEPISKYLPEWKDMRVGIDSVDPKTGDVTFNTVAAKKPITVQDLMRHTSGLTYGPPLSEKTGVQKLYKEAGIWSQKWVLADFSKALAKLPLAFEPGTTWEYGHSTDILGRVVEAASGKTLDVFLRERIFTPLKMADTAFDVPAAKHDRIAEPQPDPKTGKTPELIDVRQPATFFAGGHGLVTTVGDYVRFSQMLLNGGELEGARILSRKTVELMTSNHVGPNIAVGSLWIPGDGYGFGLGFGVRKDAGLAPYPGSVGDYFWGGYGGTYFWLDPKEQLAPVLMFQDVARRAHYRVIFRDLVYQALD